MLGFATEVRQLIHGLGALDTVAVKVASVEASSMAQKTVAEGSSGVFEIMVKKAEEETISEVPRHAKVVVLVQKLASVLGKPEPSSMDSLLLASAVVSDDAISAVLEKQANTKLAEAQIFGREYFVELLRKVL